jgi:hypothetical protein
MSHGYFASILIKQYGRFLRRREWNWATNTSSDKRMFMMFVDWTRRFRFNVLSDDQNVDPTFFAEEIIGLLEEICYPECWNAHERKVRMHRCIDASMHWCTIRKGLKQRLHSQNSWECSTCFTVRISLYVTCFFADTSSGSWWITSSWRGISFSQWLLPSWRTFLRMCCIGCFPIGERGCNDILIWMEPPSSQEHEWSLNSLRTPIHVESPSR